MRGFQQATAAAWRGIKYQCAALVRMAGIVYGALTTAHASVYDILVKKHIAVRWVFVVTLTGFNLAFALPLAVWIISGFAGEFVQFDALNLWQLTWVIWAAYFEVMRSCARYAQCSTDGVLAYTWAYFAYLSQHRDSLAFHVLFSSYLTAATMYQGSLSMSLLKASPVYRSVSPLACFYSFFCYGLALWAIGLNGGDDPGAPYGFIALWWLVVVVGYCLAWLANLYRCNHLLFAVLRCVVGLAVLGYAIGVIWPEFYTNAWSSCARWLQPSSKPTYDW